MTRYYPDISSRGRNGEDEDNFDLRFPRSAYVYSKMLREDGKIASIYRAITLQIRSTAWRVDPNGADADIVSHVAADLGLPILGETESPTTSESQISWDEHLQKALLSIAYGNMFFEQTYAVGEDGKEHLVRLDPRLPTTIQSIHVGDDGVFDGITQRVTSFNSGEPVFIPKSRLVAYVYEPMDSSWTGSSILRPAYKHWILKDELLRLEVSALDRNSMGIPIYEGSPTAVDAQGRAGTDLEDGEYLAQSIRSGDSAGGAIPSGADMKLLGTSGQLLSPREAIEYHDDQMGQAALSHFMNLTDGSYALASVQMALYVQSLQSTASFIANVATQYIVKDLIEIAYPEYKGSIPKIVNDPISGIHDLSAAELAQLAQAKVFEMDRPTEEHIRRKYNLPSKIPIEEALEDAKQRQEFLKIKEPNSGGEDTE